MTFAFMEVCTYIIDRGKGYVERFAYVGEFVCKAGCQVNFRH